MVARDIRAEFETLRRLLLGARRADDRGPVLTVEDVLETAASEEVIEGRVRFIDERSPDRATRTSDFDYGLDELGAAGPEDAADLLLVNLEEELLAADGD